MNTNWKIPKRFVGAALPVIAIAAIACSNISATDTGASNSSQTNPPAASESLSVEQNTIQTSLDTSVLEVSTPSSSAVLPSTDSPTEASAAESAVILDADAVVAAFEEVLGRIHDETLPSVVQIRVSQRFPSEGQTPGFGGTTPFRSGEGSGFVWSEEGHIVTNAHVVADADRVIVTFPDGTEAEAEVIGQDPDSDLAVIKVDLPQKQLIPVKLGDSDNVKVGQLAVAIGNPFGQEFTTTSGIVSAIGRTIRSGNTPFSVPKVIQTDAPINPGNSGGPLLDRHGRVIGINTQIISRSGSSSGIGFAVPINTAKQVIPSLIEDGSFSYAWLGISGATIRPEVAELMDVPIDTKGAQVIQLADDGPASRAGLHGSDQNQQTDDGIIPFGGDIIIAIDGNPINSMDDLISYLIERTRPGDKVTADVIRDGGESTQIQITLGSRPEN